MVFVAILPAGAYVVGLMVLAMIAVSEGGGGHAIENAVIAWFEGWLFTPSFFLVAATVLLMLLIFGLAIADFVADKLHLNIYIDDIDNKLGTILMWLFVVTVLFHFFVLIVCVLGHGDDWSWLWNRDDWRWL